MMVGSSITSESGGSKVCLTSRQTPSSNLRTNLGYPLCFVWLETNHELSAKPNHGLVQQQDDQGRSEMAVTFTVSTPQAWDAGGAVR